MSTFLPATLHPTQPWKNGLGVSKLIAQAPPDAGFDTVLWQVSATEFGTAAPFSHLPGLDRLFTVIDGAGVELTSVDEATGAVARQIVRRLQPYAFAGDWRTTCRVLDGPVRVLNVMTRRGRFAARVEIRSGEREHHLECAASETLVAVDLHSLDAWLLDDAAAAASAIAPASGRETVAVVRLRPA